MIRPGNGEGQGSPCRCPGSPRWPSAGPTAFQGSAHGDRQDGSGRRYEETQEAEQWEADRAGPEGRQGPLGGGEECKEGGGAGVTTHGSVGPFDKPGPDLSPESQRAFEHWIASVSSLPGSDRTSEEADRDRKEQLDAG